MERERWERKKREIKEKLGKREKRERDIDREKKRESNLVGGCRTPDREIKKEDEKGKDREKE